MSQITGYNLEDYLKWELSIKVVSETDPDFNAKASELLGHSNRYLIDKEVFDQIIELFEPYRDKIEQALDNFDEQDSSWRDYSQIIDERCPHYLFDEALFLINPTNENKIQALTSRAVYYISQAKSESDIELFIKSSLIDYSKYLTGHDK